MTGDDTFTAIARRLTGFGAVTRMTGFDDVVTLDGPDLVFDDGGGNWLRLRRHDGRLLIWGFDEDSDAEIPDDELARVPGPVGASPADAAPAGFVVEIDPGGGLAGAVPPVLRDWLTDAAAERELTGWVEEFIEDSAMDLVLRREDVAAVAVNPFSRGDVDRLAAAFPLADPAAIHHFLTLARDWIHANVDTRLAERQENP